MNRGSASPRRRYRHIKALRRRADHLERRIAADPQRQADHDKQEIEALQWALEQIEKLFAMEIYMNMKNITLAPPLAEAEAKAAPFPMGTLKFNDGKTAHVKRRGPVHELEREARMLAAQGHDYWVVPDRAAP